MKKYWFYRFSAYDCQSNKEIFSLYFHQFNHVREQLDGIKRFACIYEKDTELFTESELTKIESRKRTFVETTYFDTFCHTIIRLKIEICKFEDKQTEKEHI